jgi:gamma-glutamyltranspeptidase
VNDGVQEELSQRGHKLDIKSSPIGSPVMLYIDQDSGVFYAAGDPKAYRHAAGLGGK